MMHARMGQEIVSDEQYSERKTDIVVGWEHSDLLKLVGL